MRIKSVTIEFDEGEDVYEALSAFRGPRPEKSEPAKPKKAEPKAEKPKAEPKKEPEPEPDDLGLDDDKSDTPDVTMDDVRTSLKKLNEVAGRSHVAALLDEFADTGKLPDVKEKDYKAIFLKSEEAIEKANQS